MAIKKGDTVQFAIVTRQGVQKGKRKVKTVVGNGIITVGFRGYSDFYLRKGEYKKITGL